MWYNILYKIKNMKSQIIQSHIKNFEDYVNKTENGVEFWFARDLQKLLGYSKWENFENVIEKAKIACYNAGNDCQDHFPEVGKTIPVPNGGEKSIVDIILTRYACYLIAQNGDSKKEEILLKAKDLANEITVYNAKDKRMNTEYGISEEHVKNNKAVRQTLISRGITPEKVAPKEDIKKVERKIKSEEKKVVGNISKSKNIKKDK